jgi:hypothetical protein
MAASLTRDCPPATNKTRMPTMDQQGTSPQNPLKPVQSLQLPQRVEALVDALEAVADSRMRAAAREQVRDLLDLHGAGLQRLLEIISRSAATTQTILASCARDDLVSSLLMLHGLHPVEVRARVLQALDNVRPLLRAHRLDAEIMAAVASEVRLRLRSSEPVPEAVRSTVCEAIAAALPEVPLVEVDVMTEPGAGVVPGCLSLPVLEG